MTDNKTLSNEQYEVLAKCFDGYFEISELEGLEEGRLKIIINNDLVEYTKEVVIFFKEKSEDLLATFIIHFFNDIDNDDVFDVSFTNGLSLRLLHSELTLEEKRYLLDSFIVINDDEGKQELAKQICFYYNAAGLNENSDEDLVVKALEENTDEKDWKVKIDLINAFNNTFTYEYAKEERMLNALGGGYPVLNSRGIFPIKFDNNEENRLLLDYLREKEHNVSKVIPEGERIKVTFRKKKQATTDE